MDEMLKTLHELCDIYADALTEAKTRLKKSGPSISVGDADYMDKLSHTAKSIETIIAMKEAGGGYSERYMPMYGGMSYNDGMSYASDGRGGNRGGNSYAGRRNARRDSMGRYSGNYSYAEDEMMDIIEDIRGMMGDLPEEKRRKVERLVSELER